ncbi:MAG: SUMF1/EgtB/PvdO family nonheme iron enzyme [Myxococcota bacterium]
MSIRVTGRASLPVVLVATFALVGCERGESAERAEEAERAESQGRAESQTRAEENVAAENPDENPADENRAVENPVAGANEGCPEGMAQLGDDPVCMDRFEGRVEGEGDAAVAVVAEHSLPTEAVSWVTADLACRNAEKRLCTRAEWLLACQGPAGTRGFPYGDEHEAGRCNHATAGVTTDLRVAEGGEYERCVNEDGIYDLVGNVGEWLSDANDDLRETIGGSFGTAARYARCDYANRSYQPTDTAWSGQGFRCCRDLE